MKLKFDLLCAWHVKATIALTVDTSLNPRSFPVAGSRSTAIVLCASDSEVVNRESGFTSLIHSLEMNNSERKV